MQTNFHSEHHRRLNILCGAWDTTIVMMEGDGTEGGTSWATDTYRWMPNGHFMVHEVDAIIGDQHVQSMEIFGVDAASGEFFSRSYDPDGSTNDFASKIDGMDYSVVGKVQRFTGHFSEVGNILRGEWKQLVGDDWKPFIRIVLMKRS